MFCFLFLDIRNLYLKLILTYFAAFHSNLAILSHILLFSDVDLLLTIITGDIHMYVFYFPYKNFCLACNCIQVKPLKARRRRWLFLGVLVYKPAAGTDIVFFGGGEKIPTTLPFFFTKSSLKRGVVGINQSDINVNSSFVDTFRHFWHNRLNSKKTSVCFY